VEDQSKFVVVKTLVGLYESTGNKVTIAEIFELLVRELDDAGDVFGQE